MIDVSFHIDRLQLLRKWMGWKIDGTAAGSFEAYCRRVDKKRREKELAHKFLELIEPKKQKTKIIMCDKIKFSKREAQEALNSILRNRRHKHRREQRYYHCPDCNHWHLTSKPEYV